MKSNFEEVKGYTEEKKELKDICKLMKKQEELVKMGGRVPKGLFLVGPNGVGKTKLAKAFIKESGYECVKIETSEVQEDDLSHYKTYIQKQFQMASVYNRCIIFIDEIDKLIGSSYKFFSPTNYDKGRILLEEINKYNENSNVFLLLVGNEEMKLEESLLRSGRIDRIIKVDLPNEKERESIIEYYLSKSKYEKQIDMEELICMTKNASGADIEAIINNAVTNTFLKNESVLTQTRLRMALHELLFKNKDKELRLNEKSYERLATHETGHAVVSIVLNNGETSVVSIISNGKTQGYMLTNYDEKNYNTLKGVENQICIALAGMVAEELFLNSKGTGSKEDIRLAQLTIQELIREYGYLGTDKLLIDTYKYEPGPLVSESKLRKIERLEGKILKKMYKKTKQILIANKKMFNIMLEKLKKQKVLYKEEIDQLKQLCYKK